MDIGHYTILSAESGTVGDRYLVFINRPGQRSERAKNLGRRGYFSTFDEAKDAVTKIVKYGTTNV